MPSDNKSLVNQKPTDDIPFGQTGDGPLGVGTATGTHAAEISRLQNIIRDLEDKVENLETLNRDLIEEAQILRERVTHNGNTVVPSLKREVFLAVVGGMAANGDFTVGSKLNSDQHISNAAKHAAGVASFFGAAAKEAGL